jgi:hypothetical protein
VVELNKNLKFYCNSFEYHPNDFVKLMDIVLVELSKYYSELECTTKDIKYSIEATFHDC